MLDVRTGAAFLGATEKVLRGQVARRVIPFRRLGGRIIFLRAELEAWLTRLDGCTLDEAQLNMAARKAL
jgi:helix-turn-helix protein